VLAAVEEGVEVAAVWGYKPSWIFRYEIAE
jgi:hypothetical protein